jgi:hypothetical protein
MSADVSDARFWVAFSAGVFGCASSAVLKFRNLRGFEIKSSLYNHTSAH